MGNQSLSDYINNVGLTSVLLQIECASCTKCFWIKFTACLALEYCVHCVLHECYYLSSEYSVFWLHCILDTILVYVLDSALSCQHVFWTKYVCAGYIECPVQFVHGSVCSGFSLFMVPCVLDSVCPGFSVSCILCVLYIIPCVLDSVCPGFSVSWI